MNPNRVSKINLELLTFLFVLIFISPFLHAAPMSQTEFNALVVGNYKPINTAFKQSAYIKIYEENGVLLVENRLNINTKNISTYYKMTSYQCYNHSVEYTTCGFKLELVELGGNVHFIGAAPYVRVNRSINGIPINGIRSIEIFNDIDLIDHKVLPVELLKN